MINEYGSLEALLERAEEIKQPKRRQSLIDNKELALISKKLVSLALDAPVPEELESFSRHDEDFPALPDFLRKHGFSSILKRLGEEDVMLAEA